MIDTKDMAGAFARNSILVRRQAEGLTHEDSLRQLPFRGNCLNWVLGHIAVNRDGILETLGEAPLMGEEGERYKRESDALTGHSPGVLQLEELLDRIDLAQERIAA